MRTLASLALALAIIGCVSMNPFYKKDPPERLRQDGSAEAGKTGSTQAQVDALREKIAAMQAQIDALRERTRSDEAALTQKDAELRATRERLLEMQALVDELSKSKQKLEPAEERKSGR